MKTRILAYMTIFFLTAFQSGKLDDWCSLDKSDYTAIEKYILKHPDTKHLEQALDKIIELKLHADTTVVPPTIPSHHGRNTLRIFVDNNEIIWEKYYESQSIEITSIYELAKDFLENQQYDFQGAIQEILPETRDRIIISRGIFLLILNADSKEIVKREVIYQLSRAINDYRESLKSDYIKNYPDNYNIDKYFNLIDEYLQHRIWIFSSSQIQKHVIE